MKVSKLIATSLLSLSLVVGSNLNSFATDNIIEIKGNNRYETAALIAEKQNYTSAILVNSDKSLADGLSASGISGVLNAPILLSSKDSIPKATSDKLINVSEVYIIGGENSISNKVETTLKSRGIEVKRIDGADRIQTSINVAKEIGKHKEIDTVALVNAYKDADAMSIAPVSVRDKMPIILTDGKTTTYDTNNKTAYIIGGTASMSNSIASDANKTRFAGSDRFSTNQTIVKKFYTNSNDFFISDGYKLVDALTGSTLAKNNGIVFVGFGSDISILKPANSLTIFGGINEGILHDIYGLYSEDENSGDEFISLAKAEQIALENVAKHAQVSIDTLEINYSELNYENFGFPVYIVRIDDKTDGGTYGSFFVDPVLGKVYKNINEGTY